MRGVSISRTPTDGTISEAVREKDWPAARLAMAARLAEAADATDSARDLKSIARSLTPLLDRCEADQLIEAAQGETPLARIVAQHMAMNGDRAGDGE